jgi:hypothetical protein
MGTDGGLHQPFRNIKLAKLPKEDKIRYFVAAYFEAWYTLYSFLLEDAFQEVVERVIECDASNTEPILRQGRRRSFLTWPKSSLFCL